MRPLHAAGHVATNDHVQAIVVADSWAWGAQDTAGL